MPTFARSLAALIVTVLAWGPPAIALQDAPRDEPATKKPEPAKKLSRDALRKRLAELNDQALEHFKAREFDAWEAALRELVELDPDNFVPHYNLACALSARGDAEAAEASLIRAIEEGFIDKPQLERDPMLRAVREREKTRALLSNWSEVIAAHRDTNLANHRKLFPQARNLATSDTLRLSYLSAFDERAFAEARREIETLANWAEQKLMPGILDPALASEDAWVVVVLPNRSEFSKWAASTYGPSILSGLSTVGGAYDHDKKRLIAQDLGATARHEFLHVLHWRDMTRRKQQHPFWIMEGLCSLVEDYDLIGPGGQLIDPRTIQDPKVAAAYLSPVPSWRTNTVKRMLDARALVPLKQLVATSQQDFVGQRRMGMYAHARAVFLYLWQQGKLAEWYAAYSRTFRDDPTSAKALEETLGKPIEQIDREFRAWVRELPTVPEQMSAGMASLGVAVNAGTGEGPAAEGFAKHRPDGSRPDLGLGDTITSINGRPTRDLPELLRVLSAYRPGDRVEVSYRRGKLVKNETIELIEFKP